MATDEKQEASCGNCVFFCADIEDRDGVMTGDCRRHAPRVLEIYGGSPVSEWPQVRQDSFCGDHRSLDEGF